MDPIEPSAPEYRTPVKFIRNHPAEVEALEKEKGVVMQGIGLEEGLEAWMALFDFDHDLVLDKARLVGFTDEMSYKDSWKTVIDRYARAKKTYLGRDTSSM